MFVLALFFCSGATALVYEVVWAKYLALLFGSTIQAQTVVIAVFMGGLALGNKLFGSFADRSRRHLLVYGGIELTIGIYALSFPFLYFMADRLFAAAGMDALNHMGWLLLLKGGISTALLLLPTVLMGGTLPILAAWLQQNTKDAARRSVRFYATNSLGAVCGAFLAGFILVQWRGLRGTLEFTALINVLVGLVALVIGRVQCGLTTTTARPSDLTGANCIYTTTLPKIFGWSCVLVGLTGAVSMGLEILASRCLCLILGASLQVFATVLIAFILGITLGSTAVASPRFQILAKGVASIVLMLLAAGMIGVLVFNIERLAGAYQLIQNGLSRTSTGYCYHQILSMLIALIVLGLPAAALGAVLPLWIRISGASDMMGEHVGRLLAWNTLGAVGGVLLTGFVLMPMMGLRNAFTVLAMVLALAGLISAWFNRHKVAGIASGALVLGLAFLHHQGGEDWRYAMSSGVFRLPDAAYSADFLNERRKFTQLLFYEDAADATVSVERDTPSLGYTNLTLRIDGKPDASSPGDLSTQILLGQLPMMMKPDAKDVFVLGMGSGISAGTTLGYPIERLTVADNCEPVLRAVKFFESWNHGVITNSRTRIYREDARTVLKLSPEKYDVIISEPSNPWMAGVGSVFSREFYQIAASRLKPGGIMSQWFHTYEIDDQILDLVVRTFASVFPTMEIWDVAEGDIVLLGSDRPWKSDPEVYAKAFDLSGPQRDLASIGLTSPASVLARQFASQRTAFAVPGPGRIQSDNNPILEYAAPRTFYMYLGRGANRFQGFDERTWQMDLASAEKKQILAGLGLGNVSAIFGGASSSVNHDLQAFIRNRVQGGDGNLFFGNRVMPCIFKDKSMGAIVFTPASAQTNLISRQLNQAEVTLRSDPAKQAEAVQSIKEALARLQNYRREDVDWSAAYYANLAVSASLRMGAQSQAKEILLLGLKLEPDSEALKYLARILEHGRGMHPAEVTSAALR